MHATEQTTAILVRVPMIQGCLTFKGLWDMQVRLLEILNTIKHANHPLEEMAGKIVKAGAYALVSTTPWTVPDQVGESDSECEHANTDDHDDSSTKVLAIKRRSMIYHRMLG